MQICAIQPRPAWQTRYDELVLMLIARSKLQPGPQAEAKPRGGWTTSADGSRTLHITDMDQLRSAMKAGHFSGGVR